MGGIRVDVMSCRDADTRTDYPKGLVLVAALGKPVAGPVEPDVENGDAVMIIRKQFSFGAGLQAVRAVPFIGECGWIPRRDEGAGPMFNGRFIWTGDSRFGQATGAGPFAQPVKLMDRWESAAMQATMD